MYDADYIAPTLIAWAAGGGGKEIKIIEKPKDRYFGVAMRGRYREDGKTEQHLEINGEEVSNALTTVQKDSYILQVKNSEN